MIEGLDKKTRIPYTVLSPSIYNTKTRHITDYKLDNVLILQAFTLYRKT